MTIRADDITDVTDDTFGTTFTVRTLPDEAQGRPAVLVHECDPNDRLRHLLWLDPQAAADLGWRLIAVTEPLLTRHHIDEEEPA